MKHEIKDLSNITGRTANRNIIISRRMIRVGSVIIEGRMQSRDGYFLKDLWLEGVS